MATKNSGLSRESIIQQNLDISNKNPFPNENIDPKLKEDPKFGLKVARAIFYRSLYIDSLNQTKARIRENRDYAAGRQDVNQYKALLDAEINNKGDGSWLNISWDIASPAPKIVNRIVGDIMNQEHRIQFSAIDSKSKARKEKARDEYIGKMIRRNDVIEFEKQTGVKLESTDDWAPSDMEELEIYMEMTFKESIEIAMEDVVDWTFYDNDWKRIKPRLIHDLVENNKCAIRIYWDGNFNIRIRYVDIAGLVTSYTDDPYFENTEYEGEVYKITIRELRNLSKGQLTEEQLFEIAQNAANKDGNPAWTFSRGYSTYNWQEYERTYDDYRVEVLDFVYYTTDVFRYEEKTRENGNTYFSQKSFNYKKPERSKYKVEEISKKSQQAYTGFWVVGTEYMAGYGREKNMTFPQKEGRPTPKLLHKFIIIEPNRRNGSSSSLIDNIKPSLNEIQIFTLKIRHFVAEAVPPGVAIDWDSLNSIQEGTKKWSPMKQIKLFKQKGIMIFSRQGENGDTKNGKPFEFLQNGLQDGLRPLFDGINFQMSMIENNTGLMSAADGVKPDSKSLVGIQKLQMIASNNTLREIYTALSEGIMERGGLVISRMIQDKAKFGGGLEQYISIIGKNNVNTIDFMEGLPAADFGIKTEALPTGEDLQEIIDAINLSVQNGEIRYEDGAEIKRMHPKKAARYLRFRKKKYREEAMAELAQKEQLTMERERAAAEARAQADQAKLAQETEAKRQLMEIEHAQKVELEKVKADNLIQLERAKTAGKLEEIRLAAELSLDETKSPSSLNPQPKVIPKV